MNQSSATALAAWLAKNQPDVFMALAQQAMPKELGFWDSIGDALSKVGSNIASAAGAVGSYLTSSNGIPLLTKLGGSYLQIQSQKTALELQTQLAALNRQPAPIQTTMNPATGQYEAVLTTPQGQQIMTPQIASQYLKTSWPSWALPAAIGGGLLLLFILMRRGRS